MFSFASFLAHLLVALNKALAQKFFGKIVELSKEEFQLCLFVRQLPSESQIYKISGEVFHLLYSTALSCFQDFCFFSFHVDVVDSVLTKVHYIIKYNSCLCSFPGSAFHKHYIRELVLV